MYADPEVARYISSGEPRDRVTAWRSLATMIGHWHLRGCGLWAVEDATSSKFIGRIGLIGPEGWPGLELGWALSRDVWGRGLATEGAQRAMQWAFNEFGVDQLISMVRPGNLASIRVAKKLGMVLQEEREMHGGPMLIFGRLRGHV